MQDLDLRGPNRVLQSSMGGVEAYYSIAVTASVALTLDWQWVEGAFPNANDATLVAMRMNVRF